MRLHYIVMYNIYITYIIWNIANSILTIMNESTYTIAINKVHLSLNLRNWKDGIYVFGMYLQLFMQEMCWGLERMALMKV